MLNSQICRVLPILRRSNQEFYTVESPPKLQCELSEKAANAACNTPQNLDADDLAGNDVDVQRTR